MAETPGFCKVQLTVKRIIQGECSQAMDPGKSWIIGETTPGGVCFAAFNALLPYIRTLQMGARLHIQKDVYDPLEFTCPDCKRMVIFEVKRLRE
ncbi:MAG: TIGR04076 family protein [Chloroflexi bacterium]|nr:TIGR04076 family protein [Chloroflexota bacterium]